MSQIENHNLDDLNLRSGADVARYLGQKEKYPKGSSQYGAVEAMMKTRISQSEDKINSNQIIDQKAKYEKSFPDVISKDYLKLQSELAQLDEGHLKSIEDFKKIELPPILALQAQIKTDTLAVASNNYSQGKILQDGTVTGFESSLYKLKPEVYAGTPG